MFLALQQQPTFLRILKTSLFCAQELDSTIKTINYAVNSLDVMARV